MPNSDAQRAAFDAYNFAGDARWVDYFNNITIPPGKDEAAIARRYKQKFFQRFVDSDFEVEPLAASSSTSNPGSAARPSGSNASEARQRTAAAAAAASRAATGDGAAAGSGAATQGQEGDQLRGPSWRRSSSLGFDLPTTLFLLKSWVLIMSVVAVFPFTPFPLARRCFRFALLGAIASSLHALLSRIGLPRSFTWATGLQPWLQQLFTGPELLTILHCALFLPTPKPAVLAVVPVACRMAPDVADFLRRNFAQAYLYRTYLAQGCSWLAANRTLVDLFAANIEITLGFLLIALLFTPQRSLINVVMYWQLQKLRFHSPSCAWSHRQIWAQLGAKVEPLLQQYAPFTLPVLGYAKRWFTTVAQ